MFDTYSEHLKNLCGYVVSFWWQDCTLEIEFVYNCAYHTPNQTLGFELLRKHQSLVTFIVKQRSPRCARQMLSKVAPGLASTSRNMLCLYMLFKPQFWVQQHFRPSKWLQLQPVFEKGIFEQYRSWWMMPLEVAQRMNVLRATALQSFWDIAAKPDVGG